MLLGWGLKGKCGLGLVVWRKTINFAFRYVVCIAAIHIVFAFGVSALLVCVSPSEVAEFACGCCQLCVLWLVGLAFFVPDFFHHGVQLCQWHVDRAL